MKASSVHHALQPLLDTSADALDKCDVFIALQKCLYDRFTIEPSNETNLYRLAIISIKTKDLSSANLPPEVLEKRIHQYDCHQTSLVAKMKSLYTLFVEQQLGLRLDDAMVAKCSDLRDFANLILQALQKGAV